MRSARIRTYRQIRLFAALSFLVPAGLVLAGLLLAGTATTAGAQQNEAIQAVVMYIGPVARALLDCKIPPHNNTPLRAP